MSENAVGSGGSFLNGLRVIEFADELGEYCGKNPGHSVITAADKVMGNGK